MYCISAKEIMKSIHVIFDDEVAVLHRPEILYIGDVAYEACYGRFEYVVVG